MRHDTAPIPYRPNTWRCSCGAEWGGTRKTCPTVRVTQNTRRREARRERNAATR